MGPVPLPPVLSVVDASTLPALPWVVGFLLDPVKKHAQSLLKVLTVFPPLLPWMVVRAVLVALARSGPP